MNENEARRTSVELPGLAHGDGELEALVRDLNELFVSLRNLSDEPGLVYVDVVALVVNCHVEVENVSVFEHSGVGNSVTDNLIQ